MAYVNLTTQSNNDYENRIKALETQSATDHAEIVQGRKGATSLSLHDHVSISGKAAGLTTARTITLTGDTIGSASFDGTANITINTINTGGGGSVGEDGITTAGTVDIPVDTTVTVDTFSALENNGGHWNLSVFGVSAADKFICTINAIHDGNLCYETLYGVIENGTTPDDIWITMEVESGQMVLKIQNTSLTKTYITKFKRILL
jgi:hypothetical protein